jgi:hypothetical protein
MKCAPGETYNRHSNIYDTTDCGKLENKNSTKNKSVCIKNRVYATIPTNNYDRPKTTGECGTF